MYRSKSVRRGLAVVAAAAGLWALGSGGAEAAELPTGDKALGGVADVTHAAKDTAATAGKTVNRSVEPVESAHGTVRQFAYDVRDKATGRVTAMPADDGASRSVREAEEGLAKAKGSGKAVGHVTKEAGEALSAAASAPTHKDLGPVSGVPVAASAPSATGLPGDLVIEVPELVPGVPSIGIVPLSLPALPVTPGIPSL